MSLTDFWNRSWKNKLIILVPIIILIVIVIITLAVVLTQKESFTPGKAVSQNIVTVNGHEIDCTPEVNFMTDYIKSAQELY